VAAVSGIGDDMIERVADNHLHGGMGKANAADAASTK
jgi:hypothetical protein